MSSRLSAPLEYFVDCGLGVQLCECTDLVEAREEHDEGQLVSGAVVDASAVANALQQVNAHLFTGTAQVRTDGLGDQILNFLNWFTSY